MYRFDAEDPGQSLCTPTTVGVIGKGFTDTCNCGFHCIIFNTLAESSEKRERRQVKYVLPLHWRGSAGGRYP